MDGKKNFMKFWKNMAFSWNPSQQTFVRLEDVLKMYSRHVLKTSSSRLQRDNFTTSKTSWRHLAKMSWGRLEDFLKASWKTKNCYAEDVLKTSWRHALKTSWRHVLKMSWRHVLKTSWRHYGDKQNTYWGYLYLTNLNVHLTNLYFTNLYLTILRWIQNALIRTQ